MKKLIKIIISLSIIISLICLVQKLDVLDFFVLDISEEKLSNYSAYYFEQLDLEEKKMYVRIDESIGRNEKKVFLGVNVSTNIKESINRVLTAYFYDNPQYYYISNEYLILTSDIKVANYSILELEYIIDNETEVDLKNQELETAIKQFVEENITADMNDFEKEVALHDALVKHVSYYEYKDINEIPSIKHTAYGALVEGQAVCDGYAKALKMLLEEVGIETVIVSGSTDNVAHAWNIVKLDEKYYHVDATSDRMEEKNKYVIHTYFNVTDEIIKKTHSIDTSFVIPKCTDDKYNYYLQNQYYISASDNLYKKLDKIISKQKRANILEVKADKKHKASQIIEALYELDFNRWHSDGKQSVSYSKIQDIYLFKKTI